MKVLSVMNLVRILIVLSGLVSGYFLYRICENFITWRSAFWIKVLIITGCLSMMVLPIYSTDMVNALGMFFSVLLIVLLGSTGTMLAKLSVVMIFYPVILGINYLKFSIAPVYKLQFYELSVINVVSSVLVILASAGVWGGFFYFVKDRLKEVKKYMTAHIYLVTDLLCLAAFAAIVMGVVFPSTYDEQWEQDRFLRFRIGYLAVAASIVSIIAALVLVQKMAESVKKQMEIQTQNIKAEYYQTLEQQQEQTRRFIHEVNNHFQMVEGYLAGDETEKAKNYLQEIRNSLPAGSGRKFCTDSAVNALLNSRYAKLLKLHVDVHFNIDISQLLEIEAMDLCTLFANTLDNAIEASEQVEEEKRRVTLKARCSKGIFTIHEVNSKANEIIEHKGHFLTGKGDRKAHGYGIDNMKEIVEKYGGRMEINYTEDEFSLLIYIQV